MEDKIEKFESKLLGRNAITTREVKDSTEETHALKWKIIEAAEHMKPQGTTCVGFASVFIYQNTGNEGVSYSSLTAVGGLPEEMASRALKELAIHCKTTVFGRTHKDNDKR